MVNSLSSLESLVLDAPVSVHESAETGILPRVALPSNSRLQELSVTNYLPLTIGLPTTICSITFKKFDPSTGHDSAPSTEGTAVAEELEANLAGVAPRLREFSLADSRPVRWDPSPPRPRGHHTNLIKQMVWLRRLVVPVFAVDDLPGSLAHLHELHSLTLTGGRFTEHWAKDISSAELIQFMEEYRLLQVLQLVDEIGADWDKAEWAKLRAVAERRQIALSRCAAAPLW